MINRTKFLEPTEKYLKENTLITDKTPEVARDWFNLDLIFFAMQHKNANYHEAVLIQMAYKNFQEYYGITLTLEEANKQFGDYNKESFDELLQETAQLMKL